MNLPAPQFQAIQEPDAFLHLFPYRFDYIHAEHPDPSDRPNWKTESRYPLSDRQIQQGNYLYGIRFSKQTRYLMLDIDSGSPYHPHHDPFAISRIVATLEPLGLVATVSVTSSYRGGIHLYLPFPTAHDSWAIAQVVSTLIANGGFKQKPGQLELFPNPRQYSETPSLYAAHRLPLQAGSYLLNSDFQPIYGEQTTFVQHWQFAQQRNEIDQRTLKRVLQQTKRQRHKLSGKAEKFLNDLNTEIETGWTSAGQTNRLLGRIAMREYIFGHVQRSCAPLSGAVLADAICEKARSLPGFTTHCRHQAELEERARFYARSIEGSRYYPFGYRNQPKPHPLETTEPAKPNWNQEQSQSARDRIQTAVSDLMQRNALPQQTTARRHAIRAYRIGNETLDKYKELWHPHHLKPIQGKEYHPIEEISALSEPPEPIQEGRYHPTEPNKLVPHPAVFQGQADGFQEVQEAQELQDCVENLFSTVPSEVSLGEVIDQSHVRVEIAKMQAWLDSIDSVLVREVQQFFTIHAQNELDFLVQLDEAKLEQPSDFSIEGVSMLRGFGISQPKRRRGKTLLREVRQLSDAPKQPTQQSQPDSALQAEVEAFFAQYQQEYPEEMALAWSAGVYNPLAGMEDTQARFLTLEEEDWLGVGQAVGWLLVEDELDAIYFTALPPDFALEQADWYVRPDLTTFLESPVLLREAVHLHPISSEVIQAAIDQKVAELGWQAEQLEQFIQELLEKPGNELAGEDWELLLFELQRQEP